MRLGPLGYHDTCSLYVFPPCDGLGVGYPYTILSCPLMAAYLNTTIPLPAGGAVTRWLRPLRVYAVHNPYRPQNSYYEP
jgi:hypothetical protein